MGKIEFHQDLLRGSKQILSERTPDGEFQRRSGTGSIFFDHELDLVHTPLLSTSSCEALIAASQEYDLHFKPIATDGRFGASELLLRDIDAQAESELVAGIAQHLAPITWGFWRMVPLAFSPPFLIRYDSNGIREMPAHHDFQSDISFSVALNSSFSGGGLHFVRQNRTFDHVDVGKAIVFPGKVTHLHSAPPITSGVRYVLTIWARHVEQENHA